MRHHAVRITHRGYYRLASFCTRAEAIAYVIQANHRSGAVIYRDGTTGARYSLHECKTLAQQHNLTAA